MVARDDKLTPFSFVDLTCIRVWTGGWTATPGNRNPSAWNWHFTADLVHGPSDPVTYTAWGGVEPNNQPPGEPVIALLSFVDNYSFCDLPEEISVWDSCYLCEYP